MILSRKNEPPKCFAIFAPLGTLWNILQRVVPSPSLSASETHWIGLRENLQETMVFTIKYRAFL